MEDLIACLYPHDEGEDGYAIRTVNRPENSSRLVDAESALPELQGRNSRESTAPPEDSRDVDKNEVHHGKGLQFTFTYGPKAGPGFVLGTDANTCDIVLPPLKGISRRHCYLTFDAERCLILRDSSTNGTIVEYSGKGGQKRRQFTWILGGHEIPDESKSIVIHIHPALKFKIVVARPTFPEIYYSNVDDFLEETAASVSLPLGALGIQSIASTVGLSGNPTPNQEPILLEQETLGNGAFAVVTRVWDVSTGLEYASKKFTNLKSSSWEAEASLMRQISHEHIVRLHFATEKPCPQLVLEYVPLGNLEDQHRWHRISEDEVLTILQQGLSALAFLHEQRPPIVHRDIKPANILVQSRSPFQIKLGDFGLSKASNSLKTLCGTHTYLAPELARHYGSSHARHFRYTHTIDIWSFGTLIFEYAYGLPHPGSGSGLSWCKKIVKNLNDWESDDLIDLLSSMVVIKSQWRSTARMCLETALQLNQTSRSSTPIPKSHRDHQVPVEVNQRAVLEHSTLDREVLRLLQSNVSASTLTYAEKRKRSTQRSAASSASSGRHAKKSIVAGSRKSSPQEETPSPRLAA